MCYDIVIAYGDFWYNKGMKNFLVCLAALAFCGCLSSAPKVPKKWLIGGISGESAKIPGIKRDSVKLVRVEVRSPYDGAQLAVLRADGSVAFDPANSFASSPSRLLAGAAYDVLESSGFAKTVLDSKTSVSSPIQLEVIVTRIALDCRNEGRRDASVEVMLRLVESRKNVTVSKAEAASITTDANYTQSFSTAFSNAMSEALKRL